MAFVDMPFQKLKCRRPTLFIHTLTKPPAHAHNADTKLRVVPHHHNSRFFYAYLIALIPVIKTVLNGIWLLIIAETVRQPWGPGVARRRGNSFGFFCCRNTKLL